MTGHFYSPAVLLISEITWKTLTPEQQQIITEAAAEARTYEREISLKADQELEAACAEEGMIITHPDKAPFAAAVALVYTNPSVVKAIGGGDAEAGQQLYRCGHRRGEIAAATPANPAPAASITALFRRGPTQEPHPGAIISDIGAAVFCQKLFRSLRPLASTGSSPC